MNPLFDTLKPYIPLCTAEQGKQDPSRELWIKLDFERALVRGEKVDAAAPVIVEDGHAWIAKKLLTAYINKPVDLPEHSFGKQIYVDISDAISSFSLFSFYNPDIGLLVLSEEPMDYKNRDFPSLDKQIITLADLLFEHPSPQQIIRDVLAHTGRGTHPRLRYSTQDMEEIGRVQTSDDPADAPARAYLASLVAENQKRFDRYFTVRDGKTVYKDEEARKSLRHPYYLYDEKGTRLVGVSEYTYTDADGKEITLHCDGSGNGDGYDYGGRLGVEPAYQAYCMALTYCITKKDCFKEATRLLILSAGEWEHWGEGHFLGNAAACADIAFALDMTWNAFADDPEFLEAGCRILYEKGLRMGYISLHSNLSAELHVKKGCVASQIRNRRNNWNTNCGGGLTAAALLLCDQPQYEEACAYVLHTTLEGYKYCLVQYAPDGSYIESPTYWAYGTDPYMKTIAMYKRVAGTDYGLSNTVGLRDSYRFGYYITDPDGCFWNYHDAPIHSRNSCTTFHIAAEVFEDSEPAAFERLLHGTRITTIDALLHRKDKITLPNLTPDYFARGVETVTMRSGWEKENYLFTGLHAGSSIVPHGDADSGSFVLQMGGVSWFADPGSEDYNVGNYWTDSIRYYYYRKSAEAHNTILIREEELPHGQTFNDRKVPYARITRFETVEEGCICAADMTPQYGSHCTGATRAVRLADARRVVTVADTMHFDRPVHVTWIATPHEPCSVSLSEDAKVLTMRKADAEGKEHVLSATLLCDDPDARFELIPADVALLPDIITKKNSGNERASDIPPRVMIDFVQVRDLTCNVVFRVDGVGTLAPLCSADTIAL